jgi:hypothetical protein
MLNGADHPAFSTCIFSNQNKILPPNGNAPKFETTNVPLAGIVATEQPGLLSLQIVHCRVLTGVATDMDYFCERYTTICCPLQVAY